MIRIWTYNHNLGFALSFVCFHVRDPCPFFFSAAAPAGLVSCSQLLVLRIPYLLFSQGCDSLSPLCCGTSRAADFFRL
jgi:hypothetical protein